MKTIEPHGSRFGNPQSVAAALLVIVGLFVMATRNFLLFHSVVEGFSVVVAALIAILAFRTPKAFASNLLLVLGTGYLFVGLLDFTHLLTYEDMGVFPSYGPDTPTQLWVAGRLVEAVTLVLASFFVQREFSRRNLTLLYGIATLALMGSILWLRDFPVCFVPGEGLTPFKIAAEYLVCILVAAAFLRVRSQRRRMDPTTYRFLSAAMVVMILSELSLTLYSDPFGMLVIAGHLFKAASYFLVYNGVVLRSIDFPYEELQRLNGELEQRVAERTAQLEAANRGLLEQIHQRELAEEQGEALLGQLVASNLQASALAAEKARVAGTLEVLIDTMQTGVLVCDAMGTITLSNTAARAVLGGEVAVTIEAHAGYSLHRLDGSAFPAEALPVVRAIQNGDVTRDVEMLVRRKDGTDAILLVGAAPVRDGAGSRVGAVVSFQDITSYKQAERSLHGAFTELRQRNRETSAMLEVSRAVLDSPDSASAARPVVEACKELVGASAGYVAAVTDQGTVGYILYMDVGGFPCTAQRPSITPLRGLSKESFRMGKPVYHNDFSRSEWAGLIPEGHIVIENALFAPLVVRGQVVGLLGLANKAGGFAEKDIPLVSAFADLAAVALHNSRALESLEESEERFRSVVQTAQDAIVCTDGGGNVLFWNRGAEETFGYSAEEAMGRLIIFLIPDRFHERFRRGMERLDISRVERARQGAMETTAIVKGGAEIPVELTITPWQTKQGSFFTAIARDISGRKRAEEALRKSETLYRTLVEAVVDAINVKDADGRYLLVNSEVVRRVGLPKEEILGRTALDLYGSERGLPIMEEDAQVLTSGRVLDVEDEFQEGDRVRIDHVRKVPLRAENGEVIGVVTVSRDVTERKRMEKRLLRAQRLETAGRVAGQVAHDFNNLLSPLLAYPDLIRMELPEGHRASQECDIMIEAAQRMAEINRDLLALGRRGLFDPRPTDLNRLVQQAVGHMEDRPHTLVVEFDLAPYLLPVAGAPAQLMRVISNLLSNARDAMQDMGTLTIRTENLYLDRPSGQYNRIEPGEYVRLTVGDTGCGIPPGIQNKIFDAFFTTKRTDRKRGSGLGLSVVQAIVEDHRGYLDLESEVGRGTTFAVYLPISRETAEETRGDTLKVGTETVLVVDDDPLQRALMSRMLGTLGYRVELAASGEEAVAHARERGADLLILDMIMPPGIDGMETYRRIREMHPGQRAIILSGFAELDRVRQAQAEGVGAFLAKPVALERLALAVREELDRPPRAATVGSPLASSAESLSMSPGS